MKTWKPETWKYENHENQQQKYENMKTRNIKIWTIMRTRNKNMKIWKPETWKYERLWKPEAKIWKYKNQKHKICKKMQIQTLNLQNTAFQSVSGIIHNTVQQIHGAMRALPLPSSTCVCKKHVLVINHTVGKCIPSLCQKLKNDKDKYSTWNCKPRA